MGKFAELRTKYDLNEAVLYLLGLQIKDAENIAASLGFLSGDHLIAGDKAKLKNKSPASGLSAEKIVEYNEARLALEGAIRDDDIQAEPVYHDESGWPDNYVLKKSDLDRWSNNPASNLESELNARIFELTMALGEANAKVQQLKAENTKIENARKNDVVAGKSKPLLLQLIGGLLVECYGNDYVKDIVTSTRNPHLDAIINDLLLKGFPESLIDTPSKRGTIGNYIKVASEAFFLKASDQSS